MCRSYSQNDHSDRHYNAEIGDCFEDISCISNILNNCTRHKTINEFNHSLSNETIRNENFSTFFQNIDGNKTNFDNFAINEHQNKH